MALKQLKQLNKKDKYRPVLTAQNIFHILSLAKLEQPMSLESMSLIATLAPFQAKIENAGLMPAYTLSDKKSNISIDSLTAIALVDETGIFELAQATPEMPKLKYSNKEDQWALAYAKYSVDRTSCSLAEIAMAQEHMYLNDIMTEVEVIEFESGKKGESDD